MRRIPHVIFATATPLQVHWREYHALLQLLGLPTAWQEPGNYERSLQLVSEAGTPTLQDAAQAAGLVWSCVSDMRPRYWPLDPSESALLAQLAECSTDHVRFALLAHDEWQMLRGLLAKLHPARLLTVRNTRTALESVGYRFPTRDLRAPTLDVPADVRTFYERIEEYLDSVYFEVERAMFPDRTFNVGFVKCSYQQRVASSLEACRLSMERRKARVERIAQDASRGSLVELEIDELVDSDIFDQEDTPDLSAQAELTSVDLDQVLRAARIETQYLDGLLANLNRILGGTPDPKIACALDLLRSHLAAGDSVLVFSRYTDTLNAVVAAFSDETLDAGFTPYGVYTGQSASMDLGLGTQRSTRGEIRKALEHGAIRIVFCSDAASEGLNLQTARVLINVDVPWNPARLEQRIGRIARLGQKASSVDIYNLWYPDSIEARMYKRLMDRKDLYELAVGEFPDVVSAAIRAEVASRFGGSDSIADPLAQLQELRNNLQVKALRSLWARDSSGETLARQFRDSLAALAAASVDAVGGRCVNTPRGGILELESERASFSLEPGDEQVISLVHQALRWLGQREVVAPDAVRILCRGESPTFLAVDVDGEWQPIAPDSVPSLLAKLSGFETETASQTLPAVLETSSDGQLEATWMPNAFSLVVPASLTSDLPPAPEFKLADMSLTQLNWSDDTSCT